MVWVGDKTRVKLKDILFLNSNLVNTNGERAADVLSAALSRVGCARKRGSAAASAETQMRLK